MTRPVVLHRLPRFAASAAVLCGLFAPAARAQIFPSAVSAFTLPNGLRVIALRSPGARLAAVSVWVRAGSRNETAANSGAAHLLEHLLFQGRASGVTDPFDREVEALGGTMNAETTRDDTHFYVTVPREAAAAAAAALAQMLIHPAFDPDQMAVERRRAADEVDSRRDDPVSAAQDLLWSMAYPDGPYRLPAAGTAASIANLTLDQEKAFYNRWYRPDNATLVIVGDLDAAAARAAAAGSFGDWNRPAAPVPAEQTPVRPAPSSSRFVALIPGGPEALLAMAFPAPPATATRDSAVLDVIYTILTTGQRSLVGTQLEQPGLFSDYSSDFMTTRDPGLLLIWGDLPAKQAQLARNRLLSLVHGLTTGALRAEDLARAKLALLGSTALQNETVLDQNTTLGFYDAITSYQYALDYAAAVQRVTADDVKRVAARYLVTSYTVLMGPAAAAGPR